MGIYSLSEAKPIKSGAFRERDESFAEATKYADWQFFYRPPAVSAAGGPPSGPAANAAPPK
jgi:hypothetical protein